MSNEAKTSYKKEDSDFGLPQTQFKPTARGRNKWISMAMIGISIVLIIGSGAFYWVFYHSPNVPSAGKSFISEETKVEVTKDDIACVDDGEDVKVSSPPSYFATIPEKRTVQKISAPQGDYYVVVGSYIDEDLASDHANLLAKQGFDVVLIFPTPGKHFHHVAIDRAASFCKAKEKTEELLAKHGKSAWIMKY